MCGVVGCYGGFATRDGQIAEIRRGLRAILHRGPEEVGYYVDSTLSLGTVRLSIVDPLMGKQPMLTQDGRFLLGFNGEIFNFVELRAELEGYGIRFSTRSDTEVLLQTLAYWGVDEALPRLNGQFGFALYDRLDKRLVLGRDPFGQRPMYYTSRGGAFYFASEVKGIFSFPRVPRVLDPDRVLAASRLWTPIANETCFADIECLPQGHYLSFRQGQLKVTKYDTGFEAGRGGTEPADLTFDEGKEQLRHAIRESVRLRLRGDYPLGAFISGGVDSAIVAATMAELLQTQLRTFSIRVDSPQVDESAHQDKVVAAFGLDHTSVLVRDCDVRARFPKVIEQCEVPLHRVAPVGCGMLAELAGNAGVRIVLGGEGADELFLGYDIAKEALALDDMLCGAPAAQSMARLEAASTDTRHSREIDGAEILSYYERRDRQSGPLLGPHIRRFDAERLDDLLVDARGRHHADTRLMAWIETQAPDFRQWSQVSKAQWLDVHTLLIGYGMTCHGDRPGTGCGVETRFPFLDPALVALAAKFPVSWKLHEAVREKHILREAVREKHILREAFRDAVPAEVVDRPKFGMRIPGPAALLPGGTDDWVEAILSPRSLRASQLLDPKAVMKLVDAAVAAGGRSLPYPLGHTYLQALSILLMESIFVRDFSVAEHDIDRIMFRKLDGEAMRAHGKAAG